MQQQIRVEPLTGQDQWAQPTFGTAVVLQARIVEQPQKITTKEGLEVVSRLTAWVDSGSTVIGPQDRIELPDGTTPPVLAVARMPDESGEVHHTRISFGGGQWQQG
jgi:hypothetical protein